LSVDCNAVNASIVEKAGKAALSGIGTLGRAARCLATLQPWAESAAMSDADLNYNAEACGHCMDGHDKFMSLIKAVRTNLRLCGAGK
jgi:hypothetical protein